MTHDRKKQCVWQMPWHSTPKGPQSMGLLFCSGTTAMDLLKMAGATQSSTHIRTAAQDADSFMFYCMVYRMAYHACKSTPADCRRPDPCCAQASALIKVSGCCHLATHVATARIVCCHSNFADAARRWEDEGGEGAGRFCFSTVQAHKPQMRLCAIDHLL